MHRHRDFEIISYVRRGAVPHEDSMDGTAAGDVHVMSAGTGIMHPEQIAGDEDLELFQIWVQPFHKGLTPH